MSGPVSLPLSPSPKETSKIIDAFPGSNYAFLDVSVGFRIPFCLEFLHLQLFTAKRSDAEAELMMIKSLRNGGEVNAAHPGSGPDSNNRLTSLA